MDDAELLRVLRKYNPWWEGREIPQIKTGTFTRRDFYPLEKQLSTREITAIIGPRRVGKTILLHQLIKKLLDKKVPPANIFYLSVDESELGAQADFANIFDVYAKFILKQSFEDLKGRTYIFLDEIQTIPNWSTKLKNWYDLGYNLKFVISGSSSINLTHGIKESLLGRLMTTILLPLKFAEVLRIDGVWDTQNFMDLRKAFEKSALMNDPLILFKQFEDLLGKITSSRRYRIETLLSRYLIVGGYPEFLTLESDYPLISQKMQEKIRSTFYKDIILFYKLRNPVALNELFAMLSAASSSKLNVVQTAKTLDVQRPTLKTYLEHLTDIFLIENSEFYSKSRATRARKLRKVYVCDAGIRNAAISHLDESLLQEPGELGRVAEGVMFNHLRRLKFVLEPGPEPTLCYWENGCEVDFILEYKRKVIPIELKYQNDIGGEDVSGLKECVAKLGSPFGILISKKDFRQTGNILVIPMWLFLIMI